MNGKFISRVLLVVLTSQVGYDNDNNLDRLCWKSNFFKFNF